MPPSSLDQLPTRPPLLEGTINASPTPLTVPDLLDSRAASQPDSIAIQVRGGGTLTYGAWRERAVRAARGLAAGGVRPGDLVALRFTDRAWDQYAVAFLAVHYAGAAGLPLRADLAEPEAARLAELCGVGAVLTEADLPGLPGIIHHTLATVEANPTGNTENSDNTPPAPPDPWDPAQVVGTSGTTGLPKGVLASHANLTAGLRLKPRPRPYAHSRHAVHAFPIGTNAGQMMLLGALTGAPSTVVLPRFDAEEFGRAVAELGIGTAFLVPSMAIELLNSGVPARHDLSSLLLLSSSAAALPVPVAQALTEALPKATVVNVYTSAEAVPAQISMVVDLARPSSVGRPANPQDLRILNADGGALPVGDAGDVWLRQPGPSRSYIGDPTDATTVFSDGWVRMGDLGRLDADGYLHLVDRESDVIKSGALKVSTLRIEDALHEHPGVADAAALGVPHPVMGAVPVAVVVPAAKGLDLDALRLFLSTRLSRPELPVRLLLAGDLPRNATGKVLKHQLRSLFETTEASPSVPDGRPPATAVEIQLAELWQEVLGRPVRSVAEEFFALGGDSFRAVQLAAAVSERFRVEAGSALVFGRPSLRAQAAWLEDGVPTSAPEQVDRPDENADDGDKEASIPPFLRALRAQQHSVPLTSQQENFLDWMAEESGRDVGAVTALFRVTDRLDQQALGRALTELVRRHPSLRTRFVPVPGDVPGLVRTVLDEAPRARISLLDAPGASDAEVNTLLIAERDRLTDLGEDPTARLLVVSRGPRDHIVLLAVHHMVADGWSIGVLLHELGLGYDALRRGRLPRLPEHAMPYQDLVRWSNERWSAGRRYFAAALEGAPSALDPFPGRRAVDQVHTTAYPFTVAADRAGRLRERAGLLGVTPFMAVATLWSGLLAARSGRWDLVLMTPVPGRTRPEAQRAVGCLVQSLLVRVDCSGGPGFAELAERVRLAATGALDHQLYPYSEFKPSVVAFPAWLRYENWAADAHLPGLLCEPWALPRGTTVPWPLPGGDLGVPELTVVEQRDGGLDCWIQFNALAFEPDDIAALAEDFTAALNAAAH
ncbi:AMP-binding protein [Streptomyces albipurpureus]|uniref:AMP-binding protein n=1 Tax=Streptomyces albipurpureus TaxID=2897419 RepID=A0ABT0ULW2_9ACTN|nr:AMP-binding protein [Streptomyces sp. CWNU-1]MCM2389608.1 AMP-binding protein [Streptomyces sp. CWNU-1]